MTDQRGIQILLVEDNKADADLVKEIVQDKSTISINIVPDGEEALLFLRKQGRHASAPDVDFVLLDLNLPKMDGRNVLREAKSDPDLKRIPIVVLTTSEADHDITASYELNANCYIKKPSDFDCFSRVLKLLNEFWTEVVKLPPKGMERATHE